MFDRALVITLGFEGGYSNHPDDPGGETNYGVTQGTYNGYRDSKKIPRQSVKFITQDEVDDIYYHSYWIPAYCPILDSFYPSIALAVFDTAVNCGVVTAVKILQRAVGVDDDGIIGPRTIYAIRRNGDLDVLNWFLGGRRDYYNRIIAKNPKLAVFKNNWLTRCTKLEAKIKKETNGN